MPPRLLIWADHSASQELRWGPSGPFFLSLPILLRWPDELARAENEFDGLDQISAWWRCDEYQKAETSLLPRLAIDDGDVDSLILLSLCAESTQRHQQHRALLSNLSREFPSHEMTRWIHLRHWINTLNSREIENAGSELWASEESSFFLQIMRCRYLLASQQLDLLRSKLSALDPLLSNTLEIQQCKGDLAALVGDHQGALRIWQSIADRWANSRLILKRVLKLAITCRDSSAVIYAARRAIDQFGEHPDFLSSVTTIKLHQRQPGLGQRSSLLAMVWRSFGLADVDISNQFSCYEMNGLGDWLEYILPSAVESPMTQQTTFSNLTMQLASITSPRYKNHVQKYLSALRSSPSNALYKSSSKLKKDPASRTRLKVAWVIGDLAPHPVSRFVYQFFVGSQAHDFCHEHLLVNTFDYGKESCKEWFEGLPNLALVDVSCHEGEKRVAAIRELGADIAIDLSGWTSNHFLAGFLARLAPIQVNYLGYFASSGLEEMDYWLGDDHLFPTPMVEWSSEKIIRLNRPFLAWKPVAPLPEAEASISEAPRGPIRFGSFNHNRKMSDQTLSLWGKILQAVPNSILVLKANASEDPHTQKILRKRMIVHGLAPDRVEWLPLTRGPLEHLQQYSKLDVSLDPCPNGGCTTTCESLWMGVPVITLKGSHYVSRMSTAVLVGAQLDDWIADSANDYLSKAKQAADQLSVLRQNRMKWRHQLLQSPLGDPTGLMCALEAAFTEMAQRTVGDACDTEIRVVG